MERLRPEGEAPPDPEASAAFAAKFWKLINTPTPAGMQGRNPESLTLQAEVAYNAAVVEGRAPPRARSPVPVANDAELAAARAARMAQLAADEETRLELKRARKSEGDG
jgi:hypothetical protein